jgi:MFS family permease
MKSVLPTQAIYISLFITAINVIMTFPPIFLVDKVGRKSLLLISACSMAITSFILGFSINYEIAHISSLAIILFVASFSVGLGPIPFVILSEVVPSYAVGAAGSLGLALNWASNFLVVSHFILLCFPSITVSNIFADMNDLLTQGLVFLPLRNLMASPDGDGDGNVFFIFTVFGIISSSLINKMYHHQV